MKWPLRRPTAIGRDASAPTTAQCTDSPRDLRARAERLHRVVRAVAIEAKWAAYAVLCALVIAKIVGITPS